MSIKQQYQSIDPSVPAALFRRLMREPDLAYLREGKGIYGFEIHLQKDQALSGYALIGIRKHTILAFRREGQYQLVLFPTLDKLFDSTYDLLGCYVTKKYFRNDQFIGDKINEGKLKDMVKDLTPPVKPLNLPHNLLDLVEARMTEITSELKDKVHTRQHTVTQNPPPIQDVDDYEEMDSFDFEEDDQGFEFDDDQEFDFSQDQVFDLPEEPELSPAEQMKLETFHSHQEIMDKAILLGANKDILVTVLNAILNKFRDRSLSDQLHTFHSAVVKLFEQGKL